MDLETLKNDATLVALFTGVRPPVFASTPGSEKKYTSQKSMVSGWERGDVFVCEDGQTITEADAARLANEGRDMLVLYQGPAHAVQPIAISTIEYVKHKRSLN